MAELSRFYGIIIRMYFGDHNPPHFHVFYGGEMAEIDIRTLEIIAGKIPKRAYHRFWNGQPNTGKNCLKIGN
jgi:hypothetical protein